MYHSEQESDSTVDYYRRYRTSPLDWLASMPVTPRRFRPWLRGFFMACAVLLVAYWVGPRWGVSPFHSRQDGLDYRPYFTDVGGVVTNALPHEKLLSAVTLNLVGNWPGWRVEQHDGGVAFYDISLKDKEGNLMWIQRFDRNPYAGDWRFSQQDSGWAWCGGWRVSINSPQIYSDSALYLTLGGEPRVIRHIPFMPPR
ncbi:hypothetical protein [Silvimonas iriomotensis]|uniref:Uncharacterized protein n=1 Tax=Silvimonas iriomotensis TaxID=449662 RepID=A0ABQ2PCB3_9NEIS|nr:hypothetical protein [Silvimonas iriomotensis]GGP23051.1 hypothetical protein GCM10010970_30510 [Silvimonas iriomotensis]